MGKKCLGSEVVGELQDLLSMLHGVNPVMHSADVIVWRYDKSKAFTVSSCYANFLQPSDVIDLEGLRKIGLRIIWGAPVETGDIRLETRPR